MKSALYTNEQIGKAKAKAIKPFSQMSVKFFMAILALIVVVGGFKAMTSVVALATNFATTVRHFMTTSHAHTQSVHSPEEHQQQQQQSVEFSGGSVK